MYTCPRLRTSTAMRCAAAIMYWPSGLIASEVKGSAGPRCCQEVPPLELHGQGTNTTVVDNGIAQSTNWHIVCTTINLPAEQPTHSCTSLQVLQGAAALSTGVMRESLSALRCCCKTNGRHFAAPLHTPDKDAAASVVPFTARRRPSALCCCCHHAATL
jgi:hypothetical protein